MFASVFSWALERQRGQWSWRAALIGLVVVLPIVAIVLLCYAGIPVGFRLEMLVLLAFSGLWIAGFGLLRSRNPRFLVVLCMLFVLFQHGERSAALILGKHYADLADMLWINVSQLPQPAAPMPILRQTRSGLNVYQTGDRLICLSKRLYRIRDTLTRSLSCEPAA
jgi:4-amino-4-deoxy-L-arabinose transferase-like glycosyltransferase